MREQAFDGSVYVVAPGPVVLFFPKVRKLFADLRRMEASERNGATYYTVDGEILILDGDPSHGFNLVRSGRTDRQGLIAALAALSGDHTEETDPRAIAAHLATQRARRFSWRIRR